MIVADRKSLEEIQDMIKEYKKILLVGCKGCVTVCNVGGAKEVGVLAATFRELKVRRREDCAYCGEDRPFPGYVDYEEFCSAR